MKKLLLVFCVLFAASNLHAQNNARMLSGVNAQTGTTYTFVSQDTTRIVTFNNASPVAATLPNGATQGFGAGTMIVVINLGAGSVTITCSSCTINGAATLSIAQNQASDIYGGAGSPDVNYAATLASITSGSPGGANAQLQFNNTGAFGGTAGITTPDGNQLTVKGNSPWSDIAAFGGVATNGPIRVTAQCTNGNPQITIGNSGLFTAVGQGVTVQGCGASVSMSTPGAPTVAPQYASGPQRDHLMVSSPTGSSTYIYCIVAEDFGQGLTPCSSTTTISNGVASLGEQTATITSESLSNDTLTVNTSSGVFVANMMVDLVSGVPRFAGVMKTSTGTTGTLTIAKYASDSRITPQIVSDVPNSTSVTGTVNYYQANTIAWTVVAGARRYWICAERPGDGSLHVIGQSDQSNASSGWQANQYEDWGSTFLSGQSFPFYITDSICTGAGQPDSLTTTVSSGVGTTTPTLAVAPSQTNTSGTLKATQDSGPALVAAAAQAGNGKGCVYIPPQSSALNAFRVESYTTLLAGTCVIQSGQLQLDDTVELNNAAWSSWNQGQTPQFGVQQGAVVTEQAANPAFHIKGGNGTTIRGVTFQSTANGATAMTVDSSATKLSTVNCYLTSTSDTLGICVQYRGINGATATAIINDGSSFASGISQTTDASWVGLIDDGPAQNGSGGISGTNGYELHIQDFYGSHRAISYAGGGFLSLLHYYTQGPIVPLVMFSTPNGGGSNEVYLNDVIGDTSGVAAVANISTVPTLLIHIDGLFGAGSTTNPIISGTRPLGVIFDAWAPVGVGSYGDRENKSCLPNVVITGEYEGGNNPPTGVSHQVCQTQSLNIMGGNYPFIAAPLSAPATPTLSGPSAGGSVPVGTFQYAVSATGFDGGDTIPSPVPSSTITTTNGNQTVTVNWVAVVGAKSYNIWRCNTAAAGGCFVNVNGNLPFISGGNWLEVGFHQTGTSFNDTVASPTNNVFPTQTATGISQMDPNEAIAPEFVSPESTAPTCVSGFDQTFGIASGHRLSFCNNAGSVDQVVGAATTDTLLNKTLTSPVISTIVNTGTLTLPTATGTIPVTICSGQIALSTGAINSGTRATNTLSCSGLSTSTDSISCTFSGDTNAVTGYAPSASGGLTLKTWVSTNTVNVDQVNDTGGSITPGAATVNCKGIR